MSTQASLHWEFYFVSSFKLSPPCSGETQLSGSVSWVQKVSNKKLGSESQFYHVVAEWPRESLHLSEPQLLHHHCKWQHYLPGLF